MVWRRPGGLYSENLFGWLLVIVSLISPVVVFTMLLQASATKVYRRLKAWIQERDGGDGEDAATDTANPIRDDATCAGIEMTGAQPARATPSRTGASVAPAAGGSERGDEDPEHFNLADVYLTHARGSLVSGTNSSVRVPARSM